VGEGGEILPAAVPGGSCEEEEEEEEEEDGRGGEGCALELGEEEAARLLALVEAVEAAPLGAARSAAECALEASLSPSVRDAFQRALAKGWAAAQAVEGVTPWWVEGSPTPPPFCTVEEICGGEGGSSAEGAAAAPAAGQRRPFRPPVQPLAVLRPSGRPPSPALRNSALEVLHAYAHTYLLHNGELASAAAAHTLLSLSACLSRDARYPSPREACAAALAASGQASVRLAPLPSPALSLLVLRDAVALGILVRPRSALEALLHAWTCLRSSPAPPAAEKKLSFLCSWAQEYLTEDLCGALRKAVLEVCEEGMAGLVGAHVAGEGGGGGEGVSSAGAAAPASPPTALQDALAGRLLLRRSTLQGLPGLLLLGRSNKLSV